MSNNQDNISSSHGQGSSKETQQPLPQQVEDNGKSLSLMSISKLPEISNDFDDKDIECIMQDLDKEKMEMNASDGQGSSKETQQPLQQVEDFSTQGFNKQELMSMGREHEILGEDFEPNYRELEDFEPNFSELHKEQSMSLGLENDPAEIPTGLKRKVEEIEAVKSMKGNTVLERKAALNMVPEPPMPIEIRRKIDELAGAEAKSVWFGYKELYKTDLSEIHRRFLFPRKLKSILTKEEETCALSKEINVGVNVVIVDPRAKDWPNATLKIWPSMKQPVLLNSWYELAVENRFQEGNILHIWTFRISHQNDKLCFAFNIGRD